MMKQEIFLTLEAARKILNLSERSMYRYIHTGRLKAYKMGNWKIREQDLKEFIRQSSYTPNKSKSHRKK